MRSVSAGTIHTVAVSEAGEAFSWGIDAGGRLGLGDGLAQPLPQQVELPSELDGSSFRGSVVEVAAGREHTLFLLQGGVLLACGKNDVFQLGLGVSEPKRRMVLRPERVHGPAAS